MNHIKFVALVLVFALFFVSLPIIQNVTAKSSIYLREDGTVEGTDKIQRDGNVYTLIEDLSGSINPVDAFITIEKDNIVFNGDDKTIQGTGNGIAITSSGRANITIQNVRIVNFGIGIEFRLKNHERNTTASSNQILNNHIETTYFTLDISADNCTVSGNKLTSETNKYGVIFNCNNTVFSNNEFVASGLIIYEPLTMGNFFFDNTINGKPLICLENQSNQIVESAAQVILVGCNNMTVKDVKTSVDLRDTITLFGTNNTKISNCQGNIVLTNSHINTIFNNQLEYTASMVSYNSAAIKLSASNNNTITDNSIVATGSFGVSLISSSYNNVQGNKISSTGQAGVIIESIIGFTPVFNYIQENNIVCSGDGIYFKNGVQNNFVLNNLITDCKNAIKLVSGDENTFVANNISRSSQYAVYLAFSDNNTFYHNNFISNPVSVYEQHEFFYPFPSTYYSEGNTWDNGKEGNYWNDYIGKDNNADNIGDSPYVVYENNTDNYPLINPVKISAIPEFSLWTVLPFIGIATLVLYSFKKKMYKTSKT
ncbi:MAG: right-handed parallel beta-helix repeat-containing protein [Candidatus Bathyarchaeota archaeon]|nr:right-handed parallel beta-helix repeat-containing protein [Candidatus Bathyarchaeum sp.]